jgi:MEMO1 family protein
MSENVRQRKLSAGWYPQTGKGTELVLHDWCCRDLEKPRSRAVVVPHAGWTFSGRLAFDTLSTLERSKTVVVVGGHLSSSAPLVVAAEDAYETPLGLVEADAELRDLVMQNFEIVPDEDSENSVEVVLPMIRYLNPEARALWIRVGPNSELVHRLAGVLAETAQRQDAYDITVIGSTDLTHYGPAFGFTDHGLGDEAHSWVRESNDATILAKLVQMDADGVTEAGPRDRSACSAGAAAVAVEYANAVGCDDAELIGYHTSYDCQPADSFVGYAGLTYRRR